MSRIYISCANWRSGEIAAAIQAGLFGGLKGSANAQSLRASIEQHFGVPAAVLCSGTAALRIALRVLKFGCSEAQEVIVPAFVCPSVPAAVLAEGLRPKFVDVGLDLNATPSAVAEAISASTLAVIMVHMYGCPAEAAEVEAICSARGVALIDDAAQVIGVRVAGRDLGTFGDMGILSFAQSKTISCGWSGSGGALLINRGQHQLNLDAQLMGLPVMPARVGSTVSFLGALMFDRYGPMLAYYWERISKATYLRESGAEATVASIDVIGSAIAIRQLGRLPEILEERRRINSLYAEIAEELAGCTLPQYSPGRYLSRVALLAPERLSAGAIVHALRRRGFVSRRGYPLFGDLPPESYAFHLRDRVFEAPAYPGIDLVAVRSFARMLREAVRDANAGQSASRAVGANPQEVCR